jgi:hypothetical protein
LSRILFLSTVHPSAFITSLVEEKRNGNTVVDVIAGKLDLLIVSLLSGAKMAKEAMVDVLKFTFNILMHYPKSLESASNDTKVIGDNWSPKLDPCVFDASIENFITDRLVVSCLLCCACSTPFPQPSRPPLLRR